MTKRMSLVTLLSLIGILGLLSLACSQPTPTPAAPAGPTAEEIRTIVQQEVANVPAPAPAPAMPEPGPSAEEIAMMVQEAVTGAVPEGVSASEIEGIVDAAIMAASEDDLTEAEVADIVAMEVQKASAGQADPLTADEVNKIVMAAIEAIPTPEPMVIPTPASMMMEGPSGEPIKIGTLFSYTGALAPYGPPIRNGADLAAELINESGGILGRPVEAVHRDSGSAAQVATDSARALITTEDVQAIVGALSSGVTTAVAQSVTIPGEIILMSPASTAPSITVLEDGDFVFRTAPSDAAQGVILASLARELGYETAATMYINNPYGEGLSRVFTENFEAAGGAVTAQVPHEDGQATYLSEIENATEGSPDVLIAMSYPVTAEVYLREATEGGFIDTFMFVDGTKNQEMFDSLGAESFEGMYGTAPGGEETDSKALFNYLYEERFGESSSQIFHGEAFDAFAIIALAVEKAGTYEAEAVRDALREVAAPPGIKVGPGEFDYAISLIKAGQDINYEGVSGSHDFDAKGDVFNTIEIWKIESGMIASTGRFETP